MFCLFTLNHFAKFLTSWEVWSIKSIDVAPVCGSKIAFNQTKDALTLSNSVVFTL